MNLERKVRRNQFRNTNKNKGVKAEWRIFQVKKYGLENYAKMQHKSIDEVLKEKVL